MNKNASVFVAGSCWLRADFHLHTRADAEFTYTDNPNFFSTTCIQKLSDEDIRVGIVTNHNKFGSAEFKDLQRNASKKEIWLLPGIELSLKDGAKGIHVLVVFNSSWISNNEGKDYINQFLEQAFVGQSNYDHSPYPNCQYDLRGAVQALDTYDKDYFIVLAHVDATNGLFNELTGRNLEQFVRSEAFKKKVLGIQKAESRENLKKLRGMLDDHLPAQIEGSDPKSITHVGTQGKSCYIKLGDFNFEALKFALKDHLNRVAREKPVLNHSYVRSIRYQGGFLDGVELTLTPHLNTLIGIRGSGKSAIVETLRYALGIPLGLKAADVIYKKRLVEYVLGSGGKMIIEIYDQHQKQYRLERIYNQKADIYQENEFLPEVTIDAFLRKPLYFGQKDLSNTGEGFEEELINKLVGNRLNDTRELIRLKQQGVDNVIRELSRLGELKDRKEEIESQKAGKILKLKVFKEYGLEEKLQKQVQYNKDGVVFKEITEYLTQKAHELTQARQDFQQGLGQWESYKSEQNDELVEEFKQIIRNISRHLDKIASFEGLILNESDGIKKLREQFIEQQNSLKEEFAKIQREVSIPSLRAEDFVELNKSLNMLDLKLKEIDKNLNKQDVLKSRLDQYINELNNLYFREYKLIRKEVERVNQQATSLSVDINYKENRRAFQSFLDDYLRGSGLTQKDKTELVKNFKDGIEIHRDPDKLRECLSETKLASFQKAMCENLVELLTWQVPNEYIIRYRNKELKEHSIGQRASALILFVLSQDENDLIIIDQPEDDLDSQTIYEDVIKQILIVKPQIQFVFATHNPNIPVLGDAEKVVACEFQETHIALLQGSIDQRNTQEKIIGIMEGGSDAFKKRKEIYELWKP